MTDLGIKAYQTQVDDWINDIGIRYFDQLTMLGQLTEEVGEVARLMIRLHGEQSFKDKTIPREERMAELADEIGDVLFALACIANSNGINLAETLQQNIDKKTRRDKARHAGNAKLTGTNG